MPRLTFEWIAKGYAILEPNIAIRYFIDGDIAFRYWQAIRAKLDAYARGEIVDIKKLVGSDLYRFSVGQDRVIIDDQGVVVMVIEAGPRGGIYKE